MRAPRCHLAPLAPLACIACIAITGLTACHLEQPFARTNPFDPDADVTMSLAGPDSVHSLGGRVRFIIQSDPALPPGPLYFGWRSSQDRILVPGADGEFVVLSASASYTDVIVSAEFNSRLVTRTLSVGQRVAALDLWCGAAGGPAVACDAAPLAPGAWIDVRSTITDANTNAVRSLSYALARGTALARDPMVARLASVDAANGIWRLAAVGTGSTWFVVRLDVATDSVRIVVAP